MKRTLRSTLCVLAAGTLAGGLLYFVPKHPVSMQAEVKSIAEPVIEKIQEAIAPVQVVAAIVKENVAEWVGDTNQKPGVPVVLLSEPVVILGAPNGTEALPKGTPVRVLKHHGSYVQVQHASRVIMIPRTAMVLGAYRPN